MRVDRGRPAQPGDGLGPPRRPLGSREEAGPSQVVAEEQRGARVARREDGGPFERLDEAMGDARLALGLRKEPGLAKAHPRRGNEPRQRGKHGDRDGGPRGKAGRKPPTIAGKARHGGHLPGEDHGEQPERRDVHRELAHGMNRQAQQPQRGADEEGGPIAALVAQVSRAALHVLARKEGAGHERGDARPDDEGAHQAVVGEGVEVLAMGVGGAGLDGGIPILRVPHVVVRRSHARPRMVAPHGPRRLPKRGSVPGVRHALRAEPLDAETRLRIEHEEGHGGARHGAHDEDGRQAQVALATRQPSKEGGRGDAAAQPAPAGHGDRKPGAHHQRRVAVEDPFHRLRTAQEGLRQRQRHQHHHERGEVIRVHERGAGPAHVLGGPRQPQHGVAFPKELPQRIQGEERPQPGSHPTGPLEHVLAVQVLQRQHQCQHVQAHQPNLLPREVGDVRGPRAPCRVRDEAEGRQKDRMEQETMRAAEP